MSFSQAGGIIDTIAVTRSTRSDTTRAATVWSSLLESDWPGGREMVFPDAAAAVTCAMRFFLSVLSSPLCARSRNGWAIVGCGSVLVEKRVWKYSVWTRWSGSARSVK
ncbi:Uncharacterised protein [Mycobacteroides abscessus subsp. abscessus]|nr:Uncharacterised protein [Mycobacteroides abscessus subsp. abscessus]